MRLYVFEGSPEEIRETVQSVLPITADHAVSVELSTARSPTVRSRDSDQPKKFVTAEFASRVLARRPSLSAPVKAVLEALSEAYPSPVPLSDLHRVADYTPQQFAGLMGAFGRRMSHTEGYDVEAHFFDYRWDNDAGEYVYSLPETVYQALNPTGDE